MFFSSTLGPSVKSPLRRIEMQNLIARIHSDRQDEYTDKTLEVRAELSGMALRKLEELATRGVARLREQLQLEDSGHKVLR